MKNKLVKTILIYIGIIAVGWILSVKFTRFDLTSEKRFTLSDYTKKILENLNDDIYIKIYLAGDDLPSGFIKLKTALEEIIDEFAVYSDFSIEYEFINPTESDDKEDRFKMYKSLLEQGLTPIETHEETEEGKTSQKMVFPGIIVTFKGKELGVNILKNDRHFAPESEQNINNSIQALEYELTNAIQKINKNKKPQIAFIEGHGELNEYQVMDISRILSEYYMVQRGKIGGKIGILDNFEAIIIAKPRKEFSEKDKFVIDQYIMNGGKALFLLESTDVRLDSLYINSETYALQTSNNLEDQLFRYGARVNAELLLDKQCSSIGVAVEGTDGQPRIELFPWLYFPVIVSDNTHVISKYIDFIHTEFVGTIDTVGENTNVKKTILLKSSKYTKKAPVPIHIELQSVEKDIDNKQLVGGVQNIAVLLEGKFTSNFKNQSVNKYFPKFPQDSLKKESKETKIIVVADGDIIKNEVSSKGKPSPIGFDKFSKQTFEGNKEFILNAVNYLCKDAGLMTIRSRELKMRLLDMDKVKENKFTIQMINIVLPVVFIVLFGIIIFYIRKRKYTK